jgi:hypothetical protein
MNTRDDTRYIIMPKTMNEYNPETCGCWRLRKVYNYSTGCACAVAVTGPMAGTGPVAVPGVAATDTGAGDQNGFTGG